MSSVTAISLSVPASNSDKFVLPKNWDNIEILNDVSQEEIEESSFLFEKFKDQDLNKFVSSSNKGDMFHYANEVNFWHPRIELAFLTKLMVSFVETRACFEFNNMILLAQYEQADETTVYQIGYDNMVNPIKEYTIPFLYTEYGKENVVKIKNERYKMGYLDWAKMGYSDPVREAKE